MDGAMKVTFLGTGTSSGVPVIGCDCHVCVSPDPRDRRRRTSLYVQTNDLGILVDTPPDFREQALDYKIPRVDAVFFTHSHADHIFGFDDIRRYNTLQGGVIPAYANNDTLQDLRRIFNYISTEKEPGYYKPQISFHEIGEDHVVLDGIRVVPLPVEHGRQAVLGFLFEAHGRRLGYIPDCKRLPRETFERLQGIDVMILDALRYRPHATHLTIDESVSTLESLNARESWLIHLCHDIRHKDLAATLPERIHVAYDGLELTV